MFFFVFPQPKSSPFSTLCPHLVFFFCAYSPLLHSPLSCLSFFVIVPISRSFIGVYPRSRSRSVPFLINVHVPVPAPDPVLSPFPPPTYIPPMTPFVSSRPMHPVSPSVRCAFTDTVPCEESCLVPASATPCVWLHFSDRFIYKGVDISIYVLLTGGWI